MKMLTVKNLITKISLIELTTVQLAYRLLFVLISHCALLLYAAGQVLGGIYSRGKGNCLKWMLLFYAFSCHSSPTADET